MYDKKQTFRALLYLISRPLTPLLNIAQHMNVLLESELLPTFPCARHDSHHVTVTRQSEQMPHHALAQKRLSVKDQRLQATFLVHV